MFLLNLLPLYQISQKKQFLEFLDFDFPGLPFMEYVNVLILQLCYLYKNSVFVYISFHNKGHFHLHNGHHMAGLRSFLLTYAQSNAC